MPKLESAIDLLDFSLKPPTLTTNGHFLGVLGHLFLLGTLKKMRKSLCEEGVEICKNFTSIDHPSEVMNLYKL